MSDINQQPTILVTGANRGVGLGLAKTYHSRGYKVILAVRDLTKAPKLEGAIVVKIDSASTTDAKAAVEELKTKYGIEKLDIVIANAGISAHYALMKELDIAQFQEHYLINAQGPVVLFQAVYPLLKEGSKFIIVSTTGASNGVVHYPNVGTYGASKSAVTYLSRQIHFEEPHITSFAFNPGWLDTEMGKYGAASFGMNETPEKLEVTLRKSHTPDPEFLTIWIIPRN
uniref:Cytoplasmic protein n=1 Tax=Kwoniella bestiolae CBS 10118 TaxID=1296100 RepID=A0A1B9G9F0_9TREE|nr:hypothetical protein I302_02464 [Kwoniella bestiolae CBS 10118]OCF27621.1 hypothetical protein I302_02464 [Kwoniella bestiolae CBS 10118]